MQNAVFGFSTPNLGDDVQALAAALLLPSIDTFVDRDRLDRIKLDKPHNLIMNSWFAIKRYTATPSTSIKPHYFGQCIGRPELLNDIWLAEWRKNEPIGCRDLHSVSLLAEHGIKAHLTGCLTTWMGRFFHPPLRREGVIFVDVPQQMERFIPETIRGKAKRISNDTAKGNTDQTDRYKKIATILDQIRTAEMVVTRRLHASLPCVGFGTPVSVYLEGTDKNRKRFSGSDRFLPIVFHDGTRPLEREWIEPAAVSVPSDMEEHFQALLAEFGANDKPRWNSVTEFVETLPELPRHPKSILEKLITA